MINTCKVYGAAAFGHGNVNRAVSTALLATLIGATPMTVRAADTLEEVVVTAQFRKEKLQDTPIAITALSGDMLEARNQTNITQITASAPNVTLTPAGSGFGNSATASIRGVGQYDFIFAYEPGVGMYVDDVYYGIMFGSVFELTDLDRVEVLRGPQGTLAGKNSIGGAIKLFSKEPGEEGKGYVEVAAGNFDQRSLRGGADFTLVPGKLFARVSGVAKHRDGYLTRLDYSCVNGSGSNVRLKNGCAIGTEGGQDLTAVRAALRWVASDNVEDNLIVDATHDNSQVQATKLINQGPPVLWAAGANYVTGAESYTNYATYTGHPGAANAFTIPPVSTMDGWGVSNTLDVEFGGDISLKAITAYRHAEGEFSSDIDLSPADVETIYNVVSHKQFSQELRLSGGAADDLLAWTVGAFYYDATQTLGGRKDIPGGILPGGGGLGLEFLDDDTIDSDTKAGFGHLVIRPIDNLSFTTGVRHTKESKDYQFQRLTVTGAPHPALLSLNGLVGSYSGSKTDYRLGADYRWNDSLMTYVQYSTGFKGGGTNPRPFFAAQSGPFNPEILKAVEAGAKIDINRNIRVNIAVFSNKYEDIQLTALTCPTAPCAKPINAGDADIKGAEIEAQARFGGLSLDASYSKLDFEYTRIANDAGIPGVAGVQLNMVTPYTPETKYALGAQYDFVTAGGGSITPRLDWSRQGEFYTNAVNGPGNLVEAYSLLSGRLAWKDADNTWEAALSGTNLLNKFYYVNNFDLSAPPFFVTIGQPGRPREWMVTLKRNF